MTLLPHERLSDAWIASRLRDRPTLRLNRIRRNYGPIGQRLHAAALGWFVLAGVVLLASVAILAFVENGEDLWAFGLAGLGVTLFLTLGGGARALQALHAGRVHRQGRPLVR